jgi:hypothetical protein
VSLIVTIPIIFLFVGYNSDTEKARLMLNQASAFMREEKPDEAKKLLNRLAVKYGNTRGHGS